MVFCYTLGVCLVVWMEYKLVCANLVNMLMLHLIYICFQKHLPIYICFSWNLDFVVLPLKWDFNSNLFVKSFFSFFWTWLLSSKMSTLKSHIIMIDKVLVIVHLYFEAFEDYTNWIWMSSMYKYNMYCFSCINIKNHYYVF
jgi:hypothetical protein